MTSLYVVRPRVVSVDALHVMTIVSHLKSAFPTFGICDARDDCNTNHGDEPCTAIKIWCENCEVIVNRYSTHEGKMFLLQNSNKNTTTCHMNNPSFHRLNLSTKWICISSLCGKCLREIFQCENGSVIDNAHHCYTKVHCGDGRDEQQQNFGFRCSGKSRKSICVLPQKNLYDSTSQCADGSDICFVDGALISSSKQVCDRNIDCFPGFDDFLCSNQSVAQTLVGDEGSRCSPGQMYCNSSTECVAMDKVLCNISKGFVVTSSDPVVSCSVGPYKRKTTTSSLYVPHDATETRVLEDERRMRVTM